MSRGDKTVKYVLKLNDVIRKVGEHVVFTYEGNLYPGKIRKIYEDEVKISSMIPSMKSWKWPVPEDVLCYSWDDVLDSISPPTQLSKRGFYRVLELDRKWCNKKQKSVY